MSRCAARSGATAYPAALLFGAGLALWLIPPDVLLARGPVTGAIAGDVIQHVVGQRYFIADAWRWPLFDVPALGAPEGVNIALTDSIPLVAVQAKLAEHQFPGILPGSHVVLLWLALCFTVQPAAAVFVMRSAGVRRLLPCLAAAVLADSTPALLARTGHAALCGHFLILVGIGLYLRICRGSRAAVWVAAPLLLAATLLVHVYLLAMVAAVLAAAPLSLLLRRDPHWREAAAGIAAGIGLTGALALALGYGSGQAYSLAFGAYSMNLLSPVYPARSALLPWFGATPDATGGQYEGYNWLGVGGLLIAVSGAAALGRQGLLRLAWRHGGLLLASAALTLLAVSSEVWLGHRLILHVRRVPALLHQFQSSGRFFWPVAYLIVLGGAAAVAGMERRLVALALLAGAAALQFADATTLRRDVRERMQAPTAWTFDAGTMRALLAAHRRLTLLPAFGCGKRFGPDDAFLQTLLLASEHPLPVNTMYVSRWRHPPVCNAESERPPAAGELRVYGPPEQSGPLALPDGGAECRQLGQLAVCTRAATLLAGLPPVAVPSVAAGVRVATGKGADLAPLVWGWTPPTDAGTWSDGASATIAGRLTAAPVGPEIALFGRAWTAPEGLAVTASLDGQALGTRAFASGDAIDLRAKIPPGIDFSAPFVLRLGFATADGQPLDPARWRGAFRLDAFQIGAP